MDSLKAVNTTVRILKDMTPKEILLKTSAVVIPLFIAALLVIAAWQGIPLIEKMKKWEIEMMKQENERLRLQLEYGKKRPRNKAGPGRLFRGNQFQVIGAIEPGFADFGGKTGAVFHPEQGILMIAI